MTDSIKHIVGKKTGLKVNGSLWIEKDGERFFGPGPRGIIAIDC